MDYDAHTVYTDEELTFIHPEDVEMYNEWDSKTFEIQVANHELLGHGSGKLFQEQADGSRNFDPEKVGGLNITVGRLVILYTDHQPLDGQADVCAPQSDFWSSHS